MHEDDEQLNAQISIIANGQPRVLPVGSTVAALLDSLNITATYVVVQLNDVIIPRLDYAVTTLQSGYKLEIITMVGGG